MDVGYKIRRMRRWAQIVGLWQALRFEIVWSLTFAHVYVRVPGYRQPFLIRRHTSDYSVFETVFVEKEFEQHLPSNPRLIIDGGANIGLSTAFYAQRFPEALIVAVEPSSENLSLLAINCDAYQNVQVLAGGIWNRSEFLRISNPNAAAWSFRCEPAAEGTEGAFRAYTVQEIINLAQLERCDLLKLDIEGAEEQLFSEFADQWLARVDAILVEIHGAKCRSAVEAACPIEKFERTPCGEKFLIRRRS